MQEITSFIENIKSECIVFFYLYFLLELVRVLNKFVLESLIRFVKQKLGKFNFETNLYIKMHFHDKFPLKYIQNKKIFFQKFELLSP